MKPFQGTSPHPEKTCGPWFFSAHPVFSGVRPVHICLGSFSPPTPPPLGLKAKVVRRACPSAGSSFIFFFFFFPSELFFSGIENQSPSPFFFPFPAFVAHVDGRVCPAPAMVVPRSCCVWPRLHSFFEGSFDTRGPPFLSLFHFVPGWDAPVRQKTCSPFFRRFVVSGLWLSVCAPPPFFFLPPPSVSTFIFRLEPPQIGPALLDHSFAWPLFFYAQP